MLSSPDAAAFDVTGDTCAGELLPGSGCLLKVAYTPSINGNDSAAIMLNDSAADSPQKITLTGGVSRIAVGLSRTSIGFGPQQVLTSSAYQPVILTDSGSGALSLTNVTLTGPGQSNFTLTRYYLRANADAGRHLHGSGRISPDGPMTICCPPPCSSPTTPPTARKRCR